MRHLKMILVLGVLCSFAAMATIGCEKEGPMEKAGKNWSIRIKMSPRSQYFRFWRIFMV
jgi:hypothetical protein